MGVFDGVHRGHRALIELILARGREAGVPACAITFDPHPASVFRPGVTAHRITSRQVKLRLLTELGLDLVWVLPFSLELASMEAGDFVDFLCERLAIREFWIGYDFRFGRGRKGDPELLQRKGAGHGFEVHQFGPVHEEKRVLSSTWVREALLGGEIEEASRILGHSFLLEGTVGHGRGKGARVLVPTANLDLRAEQVLPANGVYAAWAERQGELYPAVVNVGLRPTLTADTRPTVEAYLIGWTGNLRGETLALHFGTRLREEKRFESLSDLRQAVFDDVEHAAVWLAGREPLSVPAPRVLESGKEWVENGGTG